jgi:tetratricopeptide (TPR) repeat protein
VLYLLADERQRLSALRDPDDGQLDVAATLSLSYAQLDALAQIVFRQLGVLVADFALPLAERVVATPSGETVEMLLHLLLRRNLVMYDAEQGRWRLHDLVRDLARQYLEQAREREAVMWRYARAVVQMAQEIQEQFLAGGEGTLAALARFDAERPHLDAGRDWATTHAGIPVGDQLLLDVAAATVEIGLLRYVARRERFPLWESTLAAAQRLGDRSAQGLAFTHLGSAYGELGEARRAIPYFEQSLTIAREIGDRRKEGRTWTDLGSAYVDLGEARRAIPYFEQSVTIAREIGDQRREAQALGHLGGAYGELGEAQRAIPYFEQWYRLHRRDRLHR